MNGGNIPQDRNTTGGLGILQVNTYLRSIGSPAEGAIVRVFDSDTKTVINELKTDAQGQVKGIVLTTPPIEYSLQYGSPRPFNQYDIQVIYQDYQEANIYNVQLFPDRVATQNILLLPSYNSINIPYPVLWGTYPSKIPESEVKRLPFPTGQIVLPEPVVPSLITVHAVSYTHLDVYKRQGLYIHIPFCAKRCLYCDFFSNTDMKFKEPYIDAAIREMELRQEYIGGEPLDTIYFGGVSSIGWFTSCSKAAIKTAA